MANAAAQLLLTVEQFTPDQIAGCQLWLAANFLNLSNGTAVTTWTDHSGHGNDYTQNTTINKPVFHTNIIGGFPSILFDGVQTYFPPPGVNVLGSTATIFLVVQPSIDSTSQPDQTPFWSENVVTFSNHYGLQVLVRIYSVNCWGTENLGSSHILTAGNNYLIEASTTTNATVLYQRGVQVASNSTQCRGLPESNNGGIGRDYVIGPVYYAGYISEIIGYNVVLSSTDRISIENYLIAKYNL